MEKDTIQKTNMSISVVTIHRGLFKRLVTQLRSCTLVILTAIFQESKARDTQIRVASFMFKVPFDTRSVIWKGTASTTMSKVTNNIPSPIIALRRHIVAEGLCCFLCSPLARDHCAF